MSSTNKLALMGQARGGVNTFVGVITDYWSLITLVGNFREEQCTEICGGEPEPAISSYLKPSRRLLSPMYQSSPRRIQ